MKRSRILMLFIVLIVVVALVFVFTMLENNSNKNVSMNNGVALTIEDFDRLYSEPEIVEIDAISRLNRNASITLSEIEVNNDSLNFKAMVDYESQQLEVIASGRLYNSTKKNSGINSVVADLNDHNNNFNIHLFEIFYGHSNDEKPLLSSSILDPFSDNSPHINIYLTDSNKNLLLFEIPIPSELNNITVNHDEDPSATKDYAWFIDVLPPSDL